MNRRAVIPVSELDKYNVAQELIRSGMRLSTVELLTGMSIRWLREAHKEITGTSPIPGRVPANCLHFIKDLLSAQRMSAFVSLHRRLHGAGKVTAKNLLVTWRSFERLCGSFDINAGFYGCRDVNDGIIGLAMCNECHLEHIYDRATIHTDSCPYCKSSAI